MSRFICVASPRSPLEVLHAPHRHRAVRSPERPEGGGGLSRPRQTPGAHVEAVTIRTDAAELVPRLGEGLSSVAIESVLESMEKASTPPLAAPRPCCRRQPPPHRRRVRVGAHLEARAQRISASSGPSAEALDLEARLADLLVFGEADAAAPGGWMGLIEHGLLALRRPVLVARGAVSATFGDKVLVAYNGSLEGSAALTRAAPMLVAAKEVEVLEIREGERGVEHAAAAVRYLRQNGANASAHEMKLSRQNAGDEICARASSIWASLIVAGGYGRSRLRELILGGTTRHLVMHAPVSVFLPLTSQGDPHAALPRAPRTGARTRASRRQPRHGYDLVAPLDAEGRLDAVVGKAARGRPVPCTASGRRDAARRASHASRRSLAAALSGG
ncbi:MAG: universal stress protein [Alphaproteobacteria bacterium]